MISSVRLEGIYKDYGLADFLLNIDNLEFSNRNIQVIVGANGSGKSTLLNILAFLDRPKTGAMFFNGQVIAYSNNGINGFHKRIGYVRQFPYLFNMDVFENIALGLKIRRYSKREVLSKVNSMLSMLNI